MISLVVLALLVLTAAADRIQSFTDGRGIIHITNLNGANRGPETPGVQTTPPPPETVPPSKAITSQKPIQAPSRLGPRDKRDKMRQLSIIGDGEYNPEKVRE